MTSNRPNYSTQYQCALGMVSSTASMSVHACFFCASNLLGRCLIRGDWCRFPIVDMQCSHKERIGNDVINKMEGIVNLWYLNNAWRISACREQSQRLLLHRHTALVVPEQNKSRCWSIFHFPFGDSTVGLKMEALAYIVQYDMNFLRSFNVQLWNGQNNTRHIYVCILMTSQSG